MTLEDKKEELLELANAWYNGTDFEPISDLDFDTKELEIIQEDPTWDYRKYLSSQGKDIVHYEAMKKVAKMQETEKSMQEVYEEMNSDDDSDNSPKYDGGGLATYYNEGELYDSLTRSSCSSGKRQLSKILSMVPQFIEDKDIVAIECEVICTLDKGHGDLSRQAATGLLNSNSLQERCEDELTIVAFKVRYKEGVNKNWVDGVKALPTLRKGNNITFIPTPFNEGRYEGNKFYCKEFSALIDGIVEYKNGKSLAHKLYFNEKKVSKVKLIEWNHTESSFKYVPKYIYNSVNVDGTDCSRATAGGTAQMLKMKCGVGATVEIIKAGLTIPQVLKPTSNIVTYTRELKTINEIHDFNYFLKMLGIRNSKTEDGKVSFTCNHEDMIKLLRSIRKSKVLTPNDKLIRVSHRRDEIVLTKKEIKDLNPTEILNLEFQKYMDLVEKDLTKQSSFNTSENYSLPFKCGCSKDLDENGKPLWNEDIDFKNELNGGLYCHNPNCSVNLNVLKKYIDEIGLPLENYIFMNPISFIEKFLKIPRFGGWSKLKKEYCLSIEEVATELSEKTANPLEIMTKYFDLSGLQKDILTVLNPLMMNFISSNIDG